MKSLVNKETYFSRIREYKLLAKKEVGQNFLVDPSLAEKTVSLLLDPSEGPILEIGPGAGSLTYFLIEKGYRGTAVDIDEGLVLKLQEDFAFDSDFKIERANALKVDYRPYVQLIGNLPYYITSSLIETFLFEAPKAKRGVFMVQKEAYERLTAGPGTRDYSPLSIMFSLLGQAKKAFLVPPSSFQPAPHVESLVFAYDFLEGRDLERAKEFHAFLKKCFALRRKTLANNLKKFYPAEILDKSLKELGLQSARAEALKSPLLETLFQKLSN